MAIAKTPDAELTTSNLSHKTLTSYSTDLPATQKTAVEEQRTLGKSLQERSVPTVPTPNILVRKQNESPRSSGSFTIVVKPGSL
jgi:hypothetical protein